MRLVSGTGGTATNVGRGGTGGDVILAAGDGGEGVSTAFSGLGGGFGGDVIINGGAKGPGSGGTGTAGDVLLATLQGNVGIGTTNPLQALHLLGSQITTGDHFIYGGDINLGTGSATSTLTSSSGNLGLATTSPWRTLSVSGTVGFSSSLTSGTTGNYLCINTATYEVTSGTTCSASSIRFKEEIEDLDQYGLKTVLKLHPVSFKYKEDFSPLDRSTKLGFLAEEVNDLIPELVAKDKDGLPESVDYQKLTAVLARAIQELNAKLETLTAQNGTINPSSSFTSSGNLTLASIQSTSGAWSLDENGKLIVKDLEADHIKAKTGEIEAGLTVKDQLTGEPICIFSYDRVLQSKAGPCSTTSAGSSGSATSVDQQTVDTPPTPSAPAEDTTPAATPEPEPSATPAPEAPATPATEASTSATEPEPSPSEPENPAP